MSCQYNSLHQGEFVHNFPVNHVVVVLTIRWPRESGDAMSNIYVMEHRLDIILKFLIKKGSMTVKIIIQNDYFNEFIRINSMPYLSVDCCVS